MRTTYYFILSFCFLSFTGQLKAQITIEGNSEYWSNYKGKYKLTLNNSEGWEWSEASDQITFSQVIADLGEGFGFKDTVRERHTLNIACVITFCDNSCPDLVSDPLMAYRKIELDPPYFILVAMGLDEKGGSPIFASKISDEGVAAFQRASQTMLVFIDKNLVITKIGADDSNNSSTDWTLVVGGSAALLIAVGAAARTLRAKKLKKETEEKAADEKTGKKQDTKKKEKEKKKKEYLYILQLSKVVIDLKSKETDNMVITAWRVNEEGEKTIAENAIIEISSTDKSFSVLPATGQGQFKSMFSLISIPQVKEAELLIKANADGKEFIAKAKVDFGPQLTLYVDPSNGLYEAGGQKNCEAKYNKMDGWYFGSLFIWFTNNPEAGNLSTPVAPPFKPVFSFTAEPLYLIFDTPIDRGDYVWKIPVKKKSDVGFEDKWLFEDGRIKVQINAKKA